MSIDGLNTLLLQFAILTVGIWGLTAMIGRLVNWKKSGIALLLGIIIYPVLTWAGVFEIPVEDIGTFQELAASLILGLISVGASTLAQDKFVKPMKERLSKNAE